LEYDYNALKEKGGKVLLDSGTTFMIFSFELYSVFKIQWAKYCRSNPMNCAKISDFQNCFVYNNKTYKSIDEFFDTFPTFTFQFRGADILLGPADYFYYNKALENYCIGIEPMRDLLLGEIFMRNFDIQFDPVNKKVGLIRANCDGSPDFKPRTNSVQFSKITRLFRERLD